MRLKILLLGAAVLTGCKGGRITSGTVAPAVTSTASTSSGSNTIAPTASASTGATGSAAPALSAGPAAAAHDQFRLATFAGTSAPATALTANAPRTYVFPASAGAAFDLAIDTQPSGSSVTLVVREAGGANLVSETLRTPIARTITAKSDARHEVVISTTSSGVTLSQVSAKLKAATYDAGSFSVVVHIAGDSFTGFGAFNDLAAQNDQLGFWNDLLAGANQQLASTGVRIDLAKSAIARLTNAQVQAFNPSLVENGVTVAESANGLNATVAAWGGLGISETDAQWGKSLDIFVVHSTRGTAPGVSGVRGLTQGGLFKGRGKNHAIVLCLFDAQGLGRPMSSLKTTLAHELGHFLGLEHTSDASFAADGHTDTPCATKALNDTNANGVLDASDTGAPDEGNLMFPFDRAAARTLSAEQGDALKAHLAMTEH